MTDPMTNTRVAVSEAEAIEGAAKYVLANSRRGNASLNDEQFAADTASLMTAYRDIIGKALASGFIRLANQSAGEREAVECAARVLYQLAADEDAALEHLDTPADRGRCAVIAAEFRRAAKIVRALPAAPDAEVL